MLLSEAKEILKSNGYILEAVEDDGPSAYDIGNMDRGRKPSLAKKVTEIGRRPAPLRGPSSHSEEAMRKVTRRWEPWKEGDMKRDKEWRLKSLNTYLSIVSKKLGVDYSVSDTTATLVYNGQPFDIEFEGASFFVTKVDRDHTARTAAPQKWKSQTCETVKEIIDFIEENS